MSTDVLWIIAVIIAIAGIVSIFRGAILAGIVLLVVACAVGPGGWSVFHDRGKHNNGLPAHAVTQLH
jgi:hypothetical protein